MELEKCESVLGNLYTLRGGLSAISVENDKANSADKECYDKLDKLVIDLGIKAKHEPETSIAYTDWICGDGLESALKESCKNELSYIIEKEVIEQEFNDNSNELKQRIKSSRKDLIFFLIAAPCSFALSLLFILLIIFYEEAMGLLILPALISCLGFLWFFPGSIFSIVAYKKQQKGLENYLKALQNNRAEETARIANERKAEADRVVSERKAVQVEYDKLLARLPAVKEEAHKIINERNAAIKPLVESCDIYYKAIAARFTPLLDERDWQNLDLVIYQLETRRADSVKEALQLVDRELQTERLENSIMAAMKSICFTLARGFTVLQTSIDENCALLRNSIELASEKISGVMYESNRQNANIAESIKGQLNNLTDRINVSNALQEKANENSQQLVEDVYELRRFNTDMYI